MEEKYEEVLVVRVHPEILTDYQRLPEELTHDPKEVFASRFEKIRHYSMTTYKVLPLPP